MENDFLFLSLAFICSLNPKIPAHDIFGTPALACRMAWDREARRRFWEEESCHSERTDMVRELEGKQAGTRARKKPQPPNTAIACSLQETQVRVKQRLQLGTIQEGGGFDPRSVRLGFSVMEMEACSSCSHISCLFEIYIFYVYRCFAYMST